MTRDVMQICELQLYRHLLCNLPDYSRDIQYIENALSGCNASHFKGFSTYCGGRRMSGDMVTSLGNGWTNLCVATYLMSKAGYQVGSYFIIVEGDDGLVQIVIPPDENRQVPRDEEFRALGFEIKMAERPDVSESTFCSLLSHPDVCDNLIDPAETLCKFGWTRAKTKLERATHLSLLRGKAMSLLCEAPGCPILRPLADYGLRVTTGIEVAYDANDRWWTEQLQVTKTVERCLRTTIDHRSRLTFERVYGISISNQLQIERYLSSLQQVQPLDFGPIRDLMLPVWRQFWQDHVNV